jgi:hypothetical protein
MKQLIVLSDVGGEKTYEVQKETSTRFFDDETIEFLFGEKTKKIYKYKFSNDLCK